MEMTGRYLRKGLLRATLSMLGLITMLAPGIRIAQADEPIRGGVVTGLWVAEPASLDPLYTNSPGGDSSTYNLFAERLVNIMPSGEVVPRLATEWKWSDDRRSLTFKLRQDVTFSDGTPFDAGAVKFNIERARDPNLTTASKQYLTNLDKVNVVDPHTVEFTFKEPSVAMMAVFASEPGVMLSPTAIKKEGENFARKPVGTGPFKVVSWTSGKVETTRNENYWAHDTTGKQLPYLDGVTMRYVPSAAVRIVELQSGAAHLGDAILEKDFEKIANDPELKLVDTHLAMDHFASFNNSAPPFDNTELRKAVSLGIDRAALAKAISGKYGVPLAGILPPTSWTNDPNLKPVAYDPAGSQKALQASGFEGTLHMAMIQRDPDTQIAQIIQAMLRQVGINLKIDMMDRSAWMDLTLKGPAQITLGRSTLPDVDPDITMTSYYGRDGSRNYMRTNDAKVVALLDEARLKTSQEERRTLYNEAQQILMDNNYQLFLFSRPVKFIARKDLQGLELELGGGAWMLDKAWLSAAN